MSEISYARWSLEPYCIGMKLRTLRTRKRLTLSRLAQETGLSTALLSKLETDRMIPTLPTLATISRVYGVGLNYFFNEASQHSLSITRKAQLHARGRSRDTVLRTPIHVAGEVSPLHAEIVELAADGTVFTPGAGGEVHCVIYVMEGRLHLDAGGARETLESGDSAHIDSKMTMAWSALGRQICRVLVVTPAGRGSRG